MTATTNSRTLSPLGRVTAVLGRVLADCQYASRRSVELQMGARRIR